MSISFHKKLNLSTIISPIACGLFVYFVLSYLFQSPRLTIPLSLVISTLIFGLLRYYAFSCDQMDIQLANLNDIDAAHGTVASIDKTRGNGPLPSLIFVSLYIILIAISAFFSKPDSDIFIDWRQFGAIGMTQLGVAIMLSFFMPGYAVVLVITKRLKLRSVIKVLFAYLISILISGTIGYVLALYLDVAISDAKSLLIGIHCVILISFIIFFLSDLKFRTKKGNHVLGQSVSFLKTIRNSIKSKASELIVFGSLFMLLIIATYYIFGGVTIGDQWFHQGRALMFMTGSIREAALSYADPPYAPLQSAMLAVFATIAGAPIVNAYASIAFLNIIPVFAFYYFFSRWIPASMQRAKILASVLFMISSGFGWMYILDLTLTTHPAISQESVLQTISSTETFDVFQPTNFLLASHPDFSTGLIYIVLPAGFVLLGLLRGNITSNFTFTIIVTLLSILGILSHDEFYLFIIIASIIPLLYRIKQGYYTYLAFLLAFLIVYSIDEFSPERYYTSNGIFGIPLIIINALFVGIAFILYIIQQRLPWPIVLKLNYLNRFRAVLFADDSLPKARLHFILAVLIISIIGFTYGLTFIVLAHLSNQDIIEQSAGYGYPYNVPWYLYPMKFGISGLLGLAFVLSYLFKRFQKEVFIFGIIIVVALLTGPYYDEHRFSKYIMIGMAGLASLFVYKIMNMKRDKRIINPLLLAAIVTVASFSSILYIGYNSLILQTQEYIHTLGRRNFPSSSEMELFQTLYNKINDHPGYNVATFPYEYKNLDDGLMTKLQAFSGLPVNKVYEIPLMLNVSNLDALYNLLDDTDTKYIIIPKNSFSETLGLAQPIRFALSHFQHAFENEKYIVLEVPNLKSSSSSVRDIAVVYDHAQIDKAPGSEVVEPRLLQYNKSFNFEGETNFVILQQNNKLEKAIISGLDSTEGITLWSKRIVPEKMINYVEVGFRIIDENSQKNNYVGLNWKEGDGQEYNLIFSKRGIELFQKMNNEHGNKIVYQNVQVQKKDFDSHRLRLENSQNSTNIYLDDTLRIQMPRVERPTDTAGINQLGITAANNIVEFGPIKVGSLAEKNYTLGTKYDDYYYPLSIIALSKNTYGNFIDRDLSALSDKYVFLTFDPLDWDDTLFNKYLEYVNKGGTLVVINHDNFKGKFSQLFSLSSDDNRTGRFTSIIGYGNQSMNVSGLVKQIGKNSSKDFNVISTYRDENNRSVAPFAIEKKFSSGGRIIVVNSEAYFRALSKSPTEYFISMSRVPALLGLPIGKTIDLESDRTQENRFIGQLEIRGNEKLKSSSFLIPENADDSHDMYADQILITSKINKQSSTYNNVTIKDLILIGRYELNIDSVGTLSIPETSSEHEYISISTPPRINMTISISPEQGSSAEIVTSNRSSIKTISINNGTIVNIYNISSAVSRNPLTFLLKDPELAVNGFIDFQQSNFDPYFTYNDIPMKMEGQTNLKFSYVDNYKESYGNGTTRTQYITYHQPILTNITNYDGGVTLELPGDISSHAKILGPPIPLLDALLSKSNIILSISVAVATIVVSWLIWNRMKFRVQHQDIGK